MAATNCEPGPPNTERIFKFVRPEINANKFWAITHERISRVEAAFNNSSDDSIRVVVRWGRIGTAGQSTAKIVNRYDLTILYTQLIRAKLAHGYIEAVAGDTKVGFSNKASAGAIVRDSVAKPGVDSVVLGTVRRKVDLSED